MGAGDRRSNRSRVLCRRHLDRNRFCCLILIVPLTAASFLPVEAVRATFQGTLRFVAFGSSWLAWCAAQCALGAIGLSLTGAPWGCFAGMLAANVATCSCLLRIIFANGLD